MVVDHNGVVMTRAEIARSGHGVGHDVQDGRHSGAHTAQQANEDQEPAVDSLPQWQHSEDIRNTFK